MITIFLKKIPLNRLKDIPLKFTEQKRIFNYNFIGKRYRQYNHHYGNFNTKSNGKVKYFYSPYLYGVVGGVFKIFVNDDDEKLEKMMDENVRLIRKNDLEKKFLNEDQIKDGWELLHYQHGLKVLRRRKHFGEKELWEYRCIGTYHDISLCDFVDAQFDLNYRLSWDLNVSCLRQIYEEDYGKKAIIRWVAKFPWPMASRLYIYKRLMMVDEENRKVILFSKGLNPTEYNDSDKKSVRVSNYISTMVVECIEGKNFFDNGINYILTYIDDPGAEIPSHLYNFIVKRSGPLFLDNVCKAAKKLHIIRNEKKMKGESYKTMFTEFLSNNQQIVSNEEEIDDEGEGRDIECKRRIKKEKLKNKVDEVKLRAVADRLKELAIKSFLEAQVLATSDDPEIIEKLRKNIQSIYRNLQNIPSDDKDLLQLFIKHLISIFNIENKFDRKNVEYNGNNNDLVSKEKDISDPTGNGDLTKENVQENTNNNDAPPI
uniref:Phosphatidylcholine transfer protein n=1 Tax=Strongyloides venezuelensis TaxID=75913 RepID=A0A0K0FH64_STRVS